MAKARQDLYAAAAWMIMKRPRQKTRIHPGPKRTTASTILKQPGHKPAMFSWFIKMWKPSTSATGKNDRSPVYNFYRLMTKLTTITDRGK